MTCDNCIHGDLCVWIDKEILYNLKGRTLELIKTDLQPKCRHFKNKAGFVEVKRGEWFVDEFPKQGKKFIICSECRSVIDCNVTYVDENEYNYCPYCGADMRKEGSDNG